MLRLIGDVLRVQLRGRRFSFAPRVFGSMRARFSPLIPAHSVVMPAQADIAFLLFVLFLGAAIWIFFIKAAPERVFLFI